jgi:hypothetical protein
MLQNSRLAVVNRNMEEGLSKVQGKAGEMLLGIWHDLRENQDVNEHILNNLNMNQLHIQAAERKFWERKAENDKKLNELEEQLVEKPELMSEYRAELERIDKEETRHYKYISDLMKSSTTFAKEYRQCAMQRKSSVDIGKVELLKSMFVAAVHRHVHDSETLQAIAQDIRQACLELLPVSSDTDIGGD